MKSPFLPVHAGNPPAEALLACLRRSYFVGAAFNTRGMQNVGLIYAMDPGLRAIHKDPGELAAARQRYLPHYNTHPFFTPLLIGVFLNLEMRIARREMPPHTLEEARKTASYALSAIGDSVFGGAVLVCWGLSAACLLAAGQGWLAVIGGGVPLAALQVFKAFSFCLGLREGFGALARLKRLGLIDWGRRIKMANAVLLVLFWWLIWPRPILWQGWLLGVGSLWGMALLAWRMPFSREAGLLLLLAAYALAPRLAAALGLW